MWKGAVPPFQIICPLFWLPPPLPLTHWGYPIPPTSQCHPGLQLPCKKHQSFCQSLKVLNTHFLDLFSLTNRKTKIYISPKGCTYHKDLYLNNCRVSLITFHTPTYTDTYIHMHRESLIWKRGAYDIFCTKSRTPPFFEDPHIYSQILYTFPPFFLSKI